MRANAVPSTSIRASAMRASAMRASAESSVVPVSFDGYAVPSTAGGMLAIGTLCIPTFTRSGVAASVTSKVNGATSTAPRSHLAPAGRAMLRWSTVIVLSHGVASMTALEEPGSCVNVGPPLSARAPSAGSSEMTVPTGLHPVVPSTRLMPVNVGEP